MDRLPFFLFVAALEHINRMAVRQDVQLQGIVVLLSRRQTAGLHNLAVGHDDNPVRQSRCFGKIMGHQNEISLHIESDPLEKHDYTHS